MGQASAEKIVYDATVDPTSSQYYGTLVVSNIRYEDDSSVTVDQSLGVRFKSPRSDAGITVLPDPWVAVTFVYSTEQLDSSTIAVTATIGYQDGYTFDPKTDKLRFQINGNLKNSGDLYTSSFELYADETPSAVVEVICPTAPDAAFAGFTQTVLLTGGPVIELPTALGTTTPFKVPLGTYKVTTAELTTPDQTVVATAQVSPSEVTVKTGEKQQVSVTYGAIAKYSSLDVKIKALLPPIDKEELRVQVTDESTGSVVDDFFSANNSATKVRRVLPPAGTAVVNAWVTLNNIKYSATKSQHLSNDLFEVLIEPVDIQTEDVDSSSFVSLPAEVEAGIESDQDISVRLQNLDVVYTATLKAETGSQKFGVLVAPGEYDVQATGIIDQGTVYAVSIPPNLTVAEDGSTTLQLQTQRGANLNVHGFPDFLSFGSLSDLADLTGRDLIAARISSLFKYAGFDGAGDSGRYLDEDNATITTIKLADTVEQALGDQQVLPIMISYTVNLSLGDTGTQLQNESGLAHSFGNLILSLNLAKEYGKPDVPAGYIVNPDFLGECQKGPTGQGYDKSYEMPVRKPLQEALEYRKVEADIPDSIGDTLGGYVEAVNWLFRTCAENVTFGWQVNVWGVGNSEWVYGKEGALSPTEVAQQTADYIKMLGVYAGENRPDFLAIDRYEADDFTERAYVNGYCYGPYEWGRYFDFCSALSLELQVPVAPWQMPASRTPTISDSVANLETEHWGSGGTYVFGDPAVGSDYHNIHQTVLAIKPSRLTNASTVEDIFKRAEPFDLSVPTYGDFPLRGIFSVLLGGGATTGVVTTIGTTGQWTQVQLKNYMDDPISLLNGHATSRKVHRPKIHNARHRTSSRRF